ncbi:ferredoxin [Actinokineospora sp.]|uniref:ferredoxin n=1 Tax=Actinokineospora sp. TaxID=1872133 RepID=UPI003D6AA1D9
MTEPQPVMDPAEQNRLTKEVGRAMVRVAGQHWQKIRAEYRSVGRHVEVDLTITAHDEQEHAIRPPTEVVSGFARLRGGMYRPGRGTWLVAVYEIEPPGGFAVEFEPDVEPAWRRVPPPIGFMDELRFFPRSDEHIPDWLRARAGMPPAVSAETQAAHTPAGGIPAPGAPVAAGQTPGTGGHGPAGPGGPGAPAPGGPAPMGPGGPARPGPVPPAPGRPPMPPGPGPVPPGRGPSGPFPGGGMPGPGHPPMGNRPPQPGFPPPGGPGFPGRPPVPPRP